MPQTSIPVEHMLFEDKSGRGQFYIWSKLFLWTKTSEASFQLEHVVSEDKKAPEATSQLEKQFLMTKKRWRQTSFQTLSCYRWFL